MLGPEPIISDCVFTIIILCRLAIYNSVQRKFVCLQLPAANPVVSKDLSLVHSVGHQCFLRRAR